MSNLKPDDKKERRKSLSDDNTEIKKIFQTKLELQEQVKKYINMKVDYSIKKYEEKLTIDLINKFMDDVEKLSALITHKLEK